MLALMPFALLARLVIQGPLLGIAAAVAFHAECARGVDHHHEVQEFAGGHVVRGELYAAGDALRRGIAGVVQPRPGLVFGRTLGEAHGGTHHADRRLVLLAEGFPLELRHVVVCGAHTMPCHADFEAHARRLFSGGDVPSDLHRALVGAVRIEPVGLGDVRVRVRRAVGHVGDVPVVCVARIPLADPDIAWVLRHDFRVLAPRAQVLDADVRDVRQVRALELVCLVQLAPWLHIVVGVLALIELDVHGLGDA